MSNFDLFDMLMSQADNVTETKTETKKFNLYQGWWCKCGEDAGEGLNCKECGADKPTEDLTFLDLISDEDEEENFLRCEKCDYSDEKNADGIWEHVTTCDIDDKVYCKECMPK